MISAQRHPTSSIPFRQRKPTRLELRERADPWAMMLVESGLGKDPGLPGIHRRRYEMVYPGVPPLRIRESGSITRRMSSVLLSKVMHSLALGAIAATEVPK